MAVIALHSAASALNGLSTSLDVIANNLANTNTDGFKGSRTNFQDLLYQERRQPGVENANGDQRPTGLYVGLGTRVAGTQLDLEQGPIRTTNNELDFFIEGRGFFEVEVGDDLSEGGLAYTRFGAFTRNSEGDIVLASDQGRVLQPQIQIPEDATTIDLLSDGTLVANINGQTEPEELGQLEVATFVNPAGLKPLGENLFAPTAASGDPNLGTPGEDGRGLVRNGALEGSNVDPVIELVSLIQTQRAFELNSQSIQAADEVLQTVGRLRSF